jgi:hypothetical protein
MKAILVPERDGPAVLKLEESPTQRLGAGQVLVRVLVAGALAIGAVVRAAAQSPPPVDTSSWKTLRDERLGFQLKHPAVWNVGRSAGTLESVLLGEPPRAGVPRVLMQVFVQRNINPNGRSIQDWYADQLRRFKVTAPPPTTSTVLGGRPTIRREVRGPDGRQYDYYTAINASDVFQVSIKQPVGEPGLGRTQEAVLSTITFVR